jgi:hypothetical protein
MSLKHTQKGLLRSLDMSESSVFAFVEGSLDATFFDRVLEKYIGASGQKYSVYTAKEFCETGGKPALINLFRLLQDNTYLRRNCFGKEIICIFFVDKDIDDYLERKIASNHFIYSPVYDLEAHLYSCGDLHRALADACRITLQQARQIIPVPSEWMRDLVRNLREWISLCIISQLRNADCGCSFGRATDVNPSPFSCADTGRIDEYKRCIASKISATHEEIEELYSTTIRHVNEAIDSNESLRYFKGKWFGAAIQKFIDESSNKPPEILLQSVGANIITALLCQVAMREDCNFCAAYIERISAVLSRG